MNKNISGGKDDTAGVFTVDQAFLPPDDKG